MPNAYKYSNWDGTQHVLDVDAESLLDAMSDDLLEEGDLWRALQRLLRQGAKNQDEKGQIKRIRDKRHRKEIVDTK